MNHMEQVAKMFGKGLNERFCIIRYVDMDSFVLEDLLTGRAEIVEDEK